MDIQADTATERIRCSDEYGNLIGKEISVGGTTEVLQRVGESDEHLYFFGDGGCFAVFPKQKRPVIEVVDTEVH